MGERDETLKMAPWTENILKLVLLCVFDRTDRVTKVTVRIAGQDQTMSGDGWGMGARDPKRIHG